MIFSYQYVSKILPLCLSFHILSFNEEKKMNNIMDCDLTNDNYPEFSDDEIRQKIIAGEFNRIMIRKTGHVQARVLNKGEVVQTYFYDHNANIKTKQTQVKDDGLVLVTKTINGKNYDSIMSALKFIKSYTKTRKGDYKPVEDVFVGFESRQKFSYNNMYEQKVYISVGDILVPRDARMVSFYQIFSYNFKDNYEKVDDLTQKKTSILYKM